MKVKFKRLSESAIIPTQAHDGDAGYDTYSPEGFTINSGETLIVNLGFSLQIVEPDSWNKVIAKNINGRFNPWFPDGFQIEFRSRSGLAAKQSVSILNSPGTIDSTYTGPICAILHNHSDHSVLISKGDRIGQLVLMPYWKMEFEEIEELTDTERGIGGLGSTGS